MPKKQGILIFLVLLLIVLILYSYGSGSDLGWWIKGVAVICIIAYIARLFEKYRGK